MSRPTEVIIDLAAIRQNYRLASKLAQPGKAIAVVKANAYGHGIVEVAKALCDDTEMFAVASLDEAKMLRQQGIKQDILLLEGCFDRAEYAEVAALNCQTVIHNSEQLNAICTGSLPRAIVTWLKIDTGMHRLGIQPEQFWDFYQQLQGSAQVSDVRLISHFSCADELDNDFTQQQLAIVEEILQQPGAAVLQAKCSLANSAAMLAWPQSIRQWNRPGIMLYGISPFIQAHPLADKLQQAMTLRSKVIALRSINKGEMVGYANHWQATRPSMIATVAAGYGDGYPRHAKSGTPVLINNRRARLVGRVSMDMLCVDVSELDNVKLGDEVTLWGSGLAVAEVATWADTIPYELVTRMPTRAIKRYI